MRLGLLGYGRMGREVERAARRRGYQVGVIVDAEHPIEGCLEALSGVDVAVEFSVPSLAAHHIRTCVGLGVRVVCGTTGWDDAREGVRALVEGTPGAGVFVSANYSVGVALTRQVCGLMRSFLGAHPEYAARIRETHHVAKLDAPSGTAIALSEALGSGWYRAGGAVEAGRVPIESVREGDVPGTHEVVLESGTDSIRLVHEAKGRAMFAEGALNAAEFLLGRAGWYGMETLLGI